MRHTIALQSSTPSQSGGFTTDSWSTQLTVRAAARTLNPREIQTAGRDVSENLVEFRMHYPRAATVQSDWRVVFKNNNYEIIGEPVNVDFMNREMIIIGKLIT